MCITLHHEPTWRFAAVAVRGLVVADMVFMMMLLLLLMVMMMLMLLVAACHVSSRGDGDNEDSSYVCHYGPHKSTAPTNHYYDSCDFAGSIAMAKKTGGHVMGKSRNKGPQKGPIAWVIVSGLPCHSSLVLSSLTTTQ